MRRAHLVMREDQVPSAGLHVERVAQVVSRDRRALDVPARPARRRTPTATTARRAARPARPSGPAGPSCPAGPDPRRARPHSSAIVSGSSPDTEPNAGSANRLKYTSPSSSYTDPRVGQQQVELLDQRQSPRPPRSGDPAAAPAARSCRTGTARSPWPPARASPRRPGRRAPAAGRPRRSRSARSSPGARRPARPAPADPRPRTSPRARYGSRRTG